MISSAGIELDAPSPGDIVTVLIRPPSVKQPAMAGVASLLGHGFGRDVPEHENPQHYRVTAIWRVLAVNGGQAVVKALTGYARDRNPEVWPINRHRWFDATELHVAMEPRRRKVQP